jgi:protocatechuate 3,4-dioxygenase beta subunit
MSRPYRLFGIFLLVVASLLVAATPAAAASAGGRNFTLPAVTKTTYSISGTVRANATSALEPNVEVAAGSTSVYGSFTYGYATTNASGAYTISHLLPGSYNLRFDPPRATNLQHGYRNATGPTYFSVSTSVAVTITTASLTGKDIRLTGGFKISGKVTRSNGTTAIPNVPVSTYGTYGSDNTTTDSAGNYTLMGLSPGSYEVSFGHDSTLSNQTGCWYTTPASKFSTSCASHTAVVISSANVAGISPKIPNALKITGYVKTPASTPAPIVGAWVDANGPVDESAYTDATGKYTISGLNPGSYKIMVGGPSGSRVPYGHYNATGPYFWGRLTAWASPVTISSAITTLPIIKPPTGYYIKGKITNTSGTALDFVLVDAVGGAGTAAENPGTWTDASGNYTIGPVPAGNTYKISANPAYSSDPSLQQGWYLNSPPNNFTTAASSALSILMNGDKNAINMRLPKGASISGTVKVTGGSACNDCAVDALNLTGSVVASTNTSSSGAYTLQGLPAGSYHVNAYTYGAVIDATHVRIITNGYYKSGLAPNFSATLAGATAIAVS